MFENFRITSDLLPSDPRFGVGPSLVPIEHLERLAETRTELVGTSHRQPAVINVVKDIREGLAKFFDIPAGYEVLIGNGGATFLFDMIGLGLVKKSSVHFTMGEFSQKWYQSHRNIPWINATEIATDYGRPAIPKFVEDHDVICCTLNETSTGVMVTQVPDVRDRDVLVCVDATSGAGQIPMDLNLVDFYFFSPQKVFAAEGGLYVAIASPKAIKRSQEIQKLSDRYIPEVMKFSHHIENSLKNQTYNTPSICTLFLLAEQVKLMNSLGRQEVEDQARRKAEYIYNWAQQRPYLSCYVQSAEHRSWAVATIDMDEKYNVSKLCQILREQKAAYDIEGYRKLGRNQFRIGLFHNISLDDLKKLTHLIDLAVSRNNS